MCSVCMCVCVKKRGRENAHERKYVLCEEVCVS